MEWNQMAVSVSSGVSVACIVAAARAVWKRWRVPKALSRRVSRNSYLKTVLRVSRAPEVERLDAFVPNLQSAGRNAVLHEIQSAWEGISGRLGARVVTQESPDCLRAGAELLSRGIDTRIADARDTDHLSYHVFSGRDVHHTVLNHRDGDRDRPNRLVGMAPAKVFKSHFNEIWSKSTPIESVLADHLFKSLDAGADLAEIAERLRDLTAKYNLDRVALEAVLSHFAFRHSAPVIFLTGLPGAGKSLVRRLLAQKLQARRFEVNELTDYVYAFRDFLHRAMLLDETRGSGFTAESGGAFRVSAEDDLQPALAALAQRVAQQHGEKPITLVEFARSDVVSALDAFGHDVLSSARVLHVRASKEVRSARLKSRAQPPRIEVVEPSLSVVVSDDHRLPSVVADSIYARDDYNRLRLFDRVKDRVHAIDNEIDDVGHRKLDVELTGFIEDIVRPYRVLIA